jgi:hypothetical protein
MIFKQIYQYYLQLVQDRIDVFRDMIAAHRDSKTMPKVLQGITRDSIIHDAYRAGKTEL